MSPDIILSLLKYGGIIVAGMSGLLGTLTRTHDAKRRLTSWGKVSVVITLVGLLVAIGSQYTEGVRQKQEAKESKEKNTRILEELHEQRTANTRSEFEFREKFQAVLVQLNAAKHEDSKRITEEKIRVIQKDFNEWATNFVKNQQMAQRDFDNAKRDFEQTKLQAQIEETKKEIQATELSFPVISFAVRYVQEAVRAFAKQTGKDIKVDAFEFPENFYEKRTTNQIQISTNAAWKFTIQAGRPVVSGYPSLRIDFTDSKGQASGRLWLRTDTSSKKFSMIYQAPVPKPDPATIAGDRDLSDYETPIREVFQRVIEAQLVQSFE